MRFFLAFEFNCESDKLVSKHTHSLLTRERDGGAKKEKKQKKAAADPSGIAIITEMCSAPRKANTYVQRNK